MTLVKNDIFNTYNRESNAFQSINPEAYSCYMSHIQYFKPKTRLTLMLVTRHMLIYLTLRLILVTRLSNPEDFACYKRRI